MHILSRFRLITAFVFDMDGVLTDGSLTIDKENNWLRKMCVRDGYALQLAVKSGFGVIVISGSDAPEVTDRLNRLGITDVFMKVKDKETFLMALLKEKGLTLNQILFMGDDIPDYACMRIAGIGACPADAATEIKEVAAYISPARGGYGCVRDVIEKVLKLHSKWPLFTTTTSI